LFFSFLLLLNVTAIYSPIGVMVVQPNAAIFAAMMQSVGTLPSHDGGDTGECARHRAHEEHLQQQGYVNIA
jgi:hypothetical protein